MKTAITRRTVLRGLGAFALALPALEIMAPKKARAGEGAPPKRFLIAYGGTSMGADGVDGVTVPDQVFPSIVGPNYDITRGLAPLGSDSSAGGLDVAADVTVVSRLKIPWGDPDGSNIPPGGKSVYFHYNTIGPQFAGTRTPADRNGEPTGPTADQVVADAIGGDTLHRVLTYRLQVANYINYAGVDNATGGTSMMLSWKRDGDAVYPVEPTFSPQLAYQSLITGFTPPDPAVAKEAELLLARRKSVLDMVDWSIGRLLPRLGQADKIRMERHFEEIRALEERLSAIVQTSGSCSMPQDPGADPPMGGSATYYLDDGTSTFDANAGYSDEDHRGEVFTDLIRIAFACDLSRSVSLLMTEWKSYMNMNFASGWPYDIHGMTHIPVFDGVADTVAWHVKQFARLVRKLRDTPEVDGSSVLDHSALVLLFEGGYGYDPESQSGPTSHSTENMCALIAGRAGGLNAGQHVVAQDRHPAAVVISAMNAVGVEGGLGELSETIPELFA